MPKKVKGKKGKDDFENDDEDEKRLAEKMKKLGLVGEEVNVIAQCSSLNNNLLDQENCAIPKFSVFRTCGYMKLSLAKLEFINEPLRFVLYWYSE